MLSQLVRSILPLSLALLAMISLVRAAGSSEPGSGVQWFDGDTKKAMEAAVAENKLVVLDGWASWCKFCFEMDEKTWSNPELGLALEREAIPVRAEIDYKTGVGESLGRRLGVEGLPAVLFIDPVQERVLVHLEGFQTTPQILEALDDARKQYEDLHGEIGASDTGSRLIRDGRRALRVGDLERAREAFEKARKLDSECRDDIADDAALGLAATATASSRAASADRETLEAEAARWLSWGIDTCPSADKTRTLWDRRVEIARRDVERGENADTATLGAWLAKRSAAFADDLDYAWQYASWAVDQGTEIEQALETAKRCVDAAPDDPRYLSLLAKVYAALDDTKTALEVLEEAIAIDPQDTQLRELRLRIVLGMRN